MPAHDHAPATAAGRHARPLAWSLALTAGFLVVEVGVGLWSRSLALLADDGHMLTDAASLALALVAIWFAAKPATPTKSYGYYRVEILATLVNAVVLLGISAAILVEAYRRWAEPPDVMAGPMIVVAPQRLLVVHQDDDVTLRWSSNHPMRVHLQRYGLEATAAPGTTATMAFRAFTTGRFKITTRDGVAPGEVTLGHLEVRPR